MLGKNSISIIGNLGGEPSLSLTRGNKKICRFSVAVNERISGRETTEWFQVVVFDKLAELCQQYLRKGSLVAVEGRLETRVIPSEPVKNKQLVNIVAKAILYLDKREISVDSPSRQEDDASTASIEASIP
jgi:single-strand DNA-binding protein